MLCRSIADKMTATNSTLEGWSRLTDTTFYCKVEIVEHGINRRSKIDLLNGPRISHL